MGGLSLLIGSEKRGRRSDGAMFDDLLAVADLIRRDNEEHSDWATPLRYVADVLPTDGSRYSSLRDQQLMRARARERGLV